MGKFIVRGLISIAVVVGIIYIITPNTSKSSVQNTKVTINQQQSSNQQYVNLGTNSENNQVNQNGVTVKISPEAKNTQAVNNFESAIENKYQGDGNVEIYIAQATGSLGGPEQVIYDVNINGKETEGLTATRTVDNSAYGTIKITMSPIVWGQETNN